VIALLLLTLGAAQPPPRPGDEGVFYGPLVRVKDGDSLVVKVQGVAMDFRLAEIDAPELDQPYGEQGEARSQIARAGAAARDRAVDTDGYGRTVAHIWNGDSYLNAEMVKRGAAWFYRSTLAPRCCITFEQEARDAKRGLWALPPKDHVEPWEWRKRKRARN
jgi:endonuclease YncB( thermonuclease family)